MNILTTGAAVAGEWGQALEKLDQLLKDCLQVSMPQKLREIVPQAQADVKEALALAKLVKEKGNAMVKLVKPKNETRRGSGAFALMPLGLGLSGTFLTVLALSKILALGSAMPWWGWAAIGLVGVIYGLARKNGIGREGLPSLKWTPARRAFLWQA